MFEDLSAEHTLCHREEMLLDVLRWTYRNRLARVVGPPFAGSLKHILELWDNELHVWTVASLEEEQVGLTTRLLERFQLYGWPNLITRTTLNSFHVDLPIGERATLTRLNVYYAQDGEQLDQLMMQHAQFTAATYFWEFRYHRGDSFSPIMFEHLLQRLLVPAVDVTPTLALRACILEHQGWSCPGNWARMWITSSLEEVRTQLVDPQIQKALSQLYCLGDRLILELDSMLSDTWLKWKQITLQTEKFHATQSLGDKQTLQGRFIQKLEQCLPTSRFANHVFVIGGYVRDRLLGFQQGSDLDLMLVKPDLNAWDFTCQFADAVQDWFKLESVKIGTDPQTRALYFTWAPDGNSELVVDVMCAETGMSLKDRMEITDFGVNALGWDLTTRRLVDPTGLGIPQLAQNVIRAFPLGLSDEPYALIPNRMLRAIRVTTRCQIKLPLSELRMIRRHASQILSSTDDIGVQLCKQLNSPQLKQCLRLLNILGLLPILIPHLAQLKADDPVTYQRFVKGAEGFNLLKDRIQLLFKPIGGDSAIWSWARTLRMSIPFTQNLLQNPNGNDLSWKAMEQGTWGVWTKRFSQILEEVNLAQHSYYVGGCVRDSILHKPCADVDLLILGDPETPGLKEALVRTAGTALQWSSSARISPYLSLFQVIMIDEHENELQFDFTFMEPGRTLLQFVEDFDFTFNCLLLPVQGGPLIDPLGHALTDLATCKLRTPIDPKETFTKRPDRLMRAWKFIYQFHWHMSGEMLEAIQACAPLISERIPKDPSIAVALAKLIFCGAPFPQVLSWIDLAQLDSPLIQAWPFWARVRAQMKNLCWDPKQNKPIPTSKGLDLLLQWILKHETEHYDKIFAIYAARRFKHYYSLAQAEVSK